MSYKDGWAAMNLEMPRRIPRSEFDAECHWELVKAVTGIPVSVESPGDLKQKARLAFIRAWNYDVVFGCLIGHGELDACRTNMGHAVYAAGGIDYDADIRCPFKTPEEVLAFDPWAVYGPRDKAGLTRRFNEHYRRQCEAHPTAVNMTGIYVSCISGLIAIFGWDLLLTATGLDPEGFGEVTNRYATWVRQYYEALADSEAPVIYSHDDIVWTSGAIFRPEWYRRYVFPNLRRHYEPLVARGKKIIFVSDGDYTEFVDDIAACGVAGFFFEPLTDLRVLAERYGKTHVLIGNVDTRVLLSGSKVRIRAEVERCVATGRSCPGYFIGVTNMIPANTPVWAALYYNEVYERLSRR
ncbi:MAG TPA: uroporphyrinogen decarboxylase family protein [Planctomycetota bacterium]|nr:uroporphyrinogen decarboxylase family protein [Planctomycetota bacterium]